MASNAGQPGRGRRRRAQAPATRASRAGTVWRFRHWTHYEPDVKWLEGRTPSPLLYVRVWLNADTRLGISRAWLDGTRRAILRTGGARLLGLHQVLLCHAADRVLLRGYLVDHLGRPAGPETIAETWGVDAEDVAEAIRMLSLPTIAILERTDWEAALAAAKASTGSLDAGEPAVEPASPGNVDGPLPPAAAPSSPLHQPPHRDGDDPPRTGGPRRGPMGGRPPPGGQPAGGPGRATTPQSGASAAGPGASAASAANSNGNPKRAGLAACGNGQTPKKNPPDPAQADREAPARGIENAETQTPTATPTPPSAATARIDGHSHDDDHADPPSAAHVDGDAGEDAQAAREDAEGRSPTTAPGEGQDGLTPPARPVHPDGSRPEDRRAPAEGEGDVPKGAAARVEPDVWVALGQEGVCWRTVLADRSGHTLGLAVYLSLGYSLRGSVRTTKRETLAFASVWRTTLHLKLPEDALRACTECGLRKAASLAQQRRLSAWLRDGRTEPNWGRIWIADWKARIAKTFGEVRRLPTAADTSECRDCESRKA